MSRKKNRIKKICEICNDEYEVIETRMNSKYCSNKCRAKRPFSAETRKKIGYGSKQKYIKNPALLEISRENGRKAIKKINESGKAFRMPKGYHTEEHKGRMRTLMAGRNVTWNDKIKKSHWAYSKNRDDVISKLLESRKTSDYFLSETHRLQLANWSINNPDKCGGIQYKRGYCVNITTNELEWYRSGLEFRVMEKLNSDPDVYFWTTQHGIQIKYIFENKSCRYIPDFFIKTNFGDFLLEMKGWIKDALQHSFKCEAGLKFANENSLTYQVIMQKDYEAGVWIR